MFSKRPLHRSGIVVLAVLAPALVASWSCSRDRQETQDSGPAPMTGSKALEPKNLGAGHQQGENSGAKTSDPKSEQPEGDGSQKTLADHGLLERVVSVGASVSAGFRTELPLANLINAAITIPHQPVLDASERIMGMNPVPVGEAQINECLDEDATLVVALDFMFWFAYGFPAKGERELTVRRSRFQKGLAYLDLLECPVIVGDLPDMREKQRYISELGIPSVAVLDALNQEFREFCDARENVFRVPLDEWVRALKSGTWIIPNVEGPPGSTRVLGVDEALLDDQLHPSRIGTLVLTHHLTEEIERQVGSHMGTPLGLKFDLERSLRRLDR